MLAESRLSATLQEACDLRNPWTGHDGLAKLKHYERRLNQLEQLLATIHSLISDRHSDTWLIQPGAGELTGGIYHYNVQQIMGTRTTFRTVQVETLTPMDTQNLYLLHEGASQPLQLLPFMRLMAAPETEHIACYFYSRLQGKNVRFVSYQFEGEPELAQPDSQVENALELLSPRDRNQDND